jgi:MFS transporter, putative metabolite:H+ symporter
VGFVYSFSRLSAVFSAFAIAFFLRDFGSSGVFVFIAGSMVMVMLSIGLFGPRVRDLPLEAISH